MLTRALDNDLTKVWSWVTVVSRKPAELNSVALTHILFLQYINYKWYLPENICKIYLQVFECGSVPPLTDVKRRKAGHLKNDRKRKKTRWIHVRSLSTTPSTGRYIHDSDQSRIVFDIICCLKVEHQKRKDIAVPFSISHIRQVLQELW